MSPFGEGAGPMLAHAGAEMSMGLQADLLR